jgi:hypothetical protein
MTADLFSALCSLPQLCAAFPSQSTLAPAGEAACQNARMLQISTDAQHLHSMRIAQSHRVGTMQTATKEDSERSDSSSPRNWRRRKQEIKRRQQLVDGYVAALGGHARVTAIQAQDIERAVDMTLLALDMRARALRGDKVAITDLTRLEGAADRAVRRLNLPVPNTAAPGDDAWRKFLASQHVATTDEGDG